MRHRNRKPNFKHRSAGSIGLLCSIVFGIYLAATSPVVLPSHSAETGPDRAVSGRTHLPDEIGYHGGRLVYLAGRIVDRIRCKVDPHFGTMGRELLFPSGRRIADSPRNKVVAQSYGETGDGLPSWWNSRDLMDTLEEVYSGDFDPTDPPWDLGRGTRTVSIEERVIALVNEERLSRGLYELKRNSTLVESARAHSLDMAENRYFSHTSRDGQTAGERIRDAGYNWKTYGENIAAGQIDAEEVFQDWMESRGHRENILDPYFEDIGVGYVYDPDSIYLHYWTQHFGAR